MIEKTTTFTEQELGVVRSLIQQRDDKIEHLVDVLKVNVNHDITEKKSLELLQEIFKINSQLNLEESAIIIQRITQSNRKSTDLLKVENEIVSPEAKILEIIQDFLCSPK